MIVLCLKRVSPSKDRCLMIATRKNSTRRDGKEARTECCTRTRVTRKMTAPWMTVHVSNMSWVSAHAAQSFVPLGARLSFGSSLFVDAVVRVFVASPVFAFFAPVFRFSVFTYASAFVLLLYSTLDVGTHEQWLRRDLKIASCRRSRRSFRSALRSLGP